MWCNKCSYGGENCKADGADCPQCPGRIVVHARPFPDKPTKHGSGKPNGKTQKKNGGRRVYSSKVKPTKDAAHA